MIKKKGIGYSEFAKGLIGIFGDNTGCSIQYGNCPCNSCFHSQEGDFKHICLLIVLALRGDYDKSEMLEAIREELQEGERAMDIDKKVKKAKKGRKKSG